MCPGRLATIANPANGDQKSAAGTSRKQHTFLCQRNIRLASTPSETVLQHTHKQPVPRVVHLGWHPHCTANPTACSLSCWYTVHPMLWHTHNPSMYKPLHLQPQAQLSLILNVGLLPVLPANHSHLSEYGPWQHKSMEVR
jgi:hypothetical protein